MNATVKDLLKSAGTAARNQETARQATQSTAAAIAAQRGTPGRTAPTEPEAGNGEQK